jgi:hypothetical protein
VVVVVVRTLMDHLAHLPLVLVELVAVAEAHNQAQVL